MPNKSVVLNKVPSIDIAKAFELTTKEHIKKEFTRNPKAKAISTSEMICFISALANKYSCCSARNEYTNKYTVFGVGFKDLETLDKCLAELKKSDVVVSV